ncbi:MULTISPECIES: hypothetical protein [unclassified Nocardiopsis]|uniref:hypothetical protein n=1 Tax=unclassified Nocardiopsis TaxID=2649073 RepID=UPI0033C9CE81
MDVEPDNDGRTPRQRDRDRKYREHVARVQRRDRLDSCVTEVRLIYQGLRHRAQRGSLEWGEFDRLWRYHGEVEKTVSRFTAAEQDQILEEYPRLAARLRAEYRL